MSQAEKSTRPVQQPIRHAGTQSVERSVQLLDELANAGGQSGLAELASSTGFPAGTVHRLLHTLMDLGLVRQTPSRRYALGPRLVRLGTAAAKMFDLWAVPHLTRLVDAVGETANLAMLDGDAVVYLSQVPSPHSMRMFTEVGRHVEPSCTGVGKAMLAALDNDEVRAIITRTGLERKTVHTLTTPDELFAALEKTRRLGYAVDEGEQEIGVRCIAMALPAAPGRFAVSVSGPAARVTPDRDEQIVPELRRAAAGLSAELDQRTP